MLGYRSPAHAMQAALDDQRRKDLRSHRAEAWRSYRLQELQRQKSDLQAQGLDPSQVEMRIAAVLTADPSVE